MEVCSESLIYYALRDEEGNYFDHSSNNYRNALGKCTRFSCLVVAEACQQLYPEFSEIRKIKVVDLGEA